MIMKIKDLKLNKNNPRFIRDESFEKLKKSINDFPQMLALKPIIIDENNVILCGNMRYRALKELGETDCHVVVAEGLTEEQKKELLIKDNLSMGEWDYEILGNFWDADKLIEWGLEIPSYASPDEYGDEFTLPDGDKAPFQQITFTLADAQAEAIKKAIDKIKKSDEYKYGETYGNENSNGNALYTIVRLWNG
jgi:hypothetical protein